eukprot:TRINITY_DN48844_c0_g1_i1.p1 TRINITY_DN48844_c0_g1~~TRINITY_DN48844_c0_g1_i1.p1  ORF type:complete len:578 (+),score=28.22 TRINITY_DN48844_c0_g1_i1:153-1736(+)
MDLLQRSVDLAAADLGIDATSAASVLSDADAYATVNLGPIGIPAMAGGDNKFRNLYPNPPLTLALRYGANPLPSYLYSSLASGHAPQLTVNTLAEQVGEGHVKIAVIAGCEFLNILKKAARRGFAIADGHQGGKTLNWGDPQESRPSKPGLPEHHKLYTKTHPQEGRHGITVPVNVYPIYEQAIRASLGRTVDEHMKQVSSVWSAFSDIAAKCPEHAWFPTRRSSDEIQYPDGVKNRYVGYPYTKYHCSVIDVDQAAALILMSVAEARRRGVPQAKWVYLHGCAEALEKDTLHRRELHRSPALQVMGEQCFKDAHVDVSQVEQFDIYSCFPSAVEVAVRELGIRAEVASDPRKLTLTGGLSFHGGPGANYAMHSIAAMMEFLRASPGVFGMVTANGGFLSKHAAGIYSTTPYSDTHPSAQRWTRTDPAIYQAFLDEQPNVTVADAPSGRGKIETYTVLHNQAGPTQAICIGALLSGNDSGKRFIAISRDGPTLARMVAKDCMGSNCMVSFDSSKSVNIFQLESQSSL